MRIQQTHRTVGGLGLVLGSLSFTAADLLRRLVEPAAPTAATRTAAIAAHQGTWLVAGLLAAASALLLVAGATVVTRLAPSRGAVLASVGGYLLGIGALASTGHTMGYFGGWALYSRSGLDASTVQRLDDTADPLGGVFIALFMIGMLLGPVLLTIGLRRAGAVPIWVPVAAVLFVVSGAVSGVAAGAVGVAAALASLGYVGAVVLRSPRAVAADPGTSTAPVSAGR
jgi:hypothetical protein